MSSAKLVTSCLTSCVQYVENYIKVWQRTTGYSVTDVQNGSVKLCSYASGQFVLYETSVLLKLLETVTSLLSNLTRPVGKEFHFPFLKIIM
jgi:hypothetical protein